MTESKEKSVPGGAIQVMQKGRKEVLTLRKIPEHVEVNTYRPDTKVKEKDVRDKTKHSTKIQAKQTKQTTNSDKTVSLGNFSTYISL